MNVVGENERSGEKAHAVPVESRVVCLRACRAFQNFCEVDK